jgi:hypothetical protein
MNQPIALSVAKPLWTAWATDLQLARMSRIALAERSTDQLREDLELMKESAEDVKPEVVYGLWITDPETLPRPITKSGPVSDEELYALGETPEEAVKKAESIRARTLARIQGELDRRG